MAISKEVVWNEVSSTNIPELVIGQVWKPLLGSFRGVHTFVPGRPGAWYTPQKRGLREIRMSCHIIAEDAEARVEAMEAVADWLDVEAEAKLTISNVPNRFYLATVGDLPDPEEWREVGSFDLVWLAQPYSFDESISVESYSQDANENHIWDPGLLAPVWPVIQITPTNGTMTEFLLEVNGDNLTWEGSVASGNSLTVNAIVPVVVTGVSTDTELTGAYNPAAVSLAGVGGTFPTLMPGSNNVHFVKNAGTATAFNIQIQYRKTYRS